MSFSNPINVPKFDKPKPSSTGANDATTGGSNGARMLLDLSQIDPSRDLFTIKYLSKDDGEAAKDVEFTIDIQEWTPTEMRLKFLFSDPLLISQGANSDLIVMAIKKPELF
jgi:hypothetical protein